MTANYKRTAQYLYALLEDSKGAVFPTLGDKILINTGDDKRLAVAIVREVRDYFGEPKNKPKNTNREALIINMADDWLEGIKRNTAKTTPQEYVDLVAKKTREKYTIDAESRANGEFTKSFDEIIKAVEQWAETKRKQPKTKKAKEPEPRKAINKHNHFCSTITDDQARRLFQLLTEKQYIKGEVSDWMIICGVREGTIEKRIDWLQGGNELGYFVNKLFGSTNGYKWAITKKVFTLKGEDINQVSIKNGFSNIAEAKWEALEKILAKAIKKDSSILNDLSNQ
jgi:hypothetical protein